MSTTFNFFDLIFIAFTLIFVITAFLRGFVKEMFALFIWVLALTVSHIATPYVEKVFSSDLDKMVLDIVVRTVIFITVFLTATIATSGLCKELKGKMPTLLDRSLGVLYGLVKTLLIFGLFYSAMYNSYGYLLGKKADKKRIEAQLPNWLREARSRSIIKMAAETLDPIVISFISSIAQNLDKAVPKSEDLDKKIDDVVNDKTSETVEEEKPVETKVDRNAGYNKKDIQKMDRLIEIIDKK